MLDADGLNAHAGLLDDLATRPAPTVLTPHEGELGRLLDVPSDDVRARRLHHAREAARRAAAVVVLKGDDTLVAEPGGAGARQPGRDAGARDRGHRRRAERRRSARCSRATSSPVRAAAAAVRLHARAGLLAAAERLGVDGVIARDVIAELPHARPRSGG